MVHGCVKAIKVTMTPNRGLASSFLHSDRRGSGPFIPRLHDTTGLTTVLNEQPLFVQPVVTPGCTTGLTTGCIHDTAVWQTCWMFVHTIQPVVKLVWQQVVSCKWGFTVTLCRQLSLGFHSSRSWTFPLPHCIYLHLTLSVSSSCVQTVKPKPPVWKMQGCKNIN